MTIKKKKILKPNHTFCNDRIHHLARVPVPVLPFPRIEMQQSMLDATDEVYSQQARQTVRSCGATPDWNRILCHTWDQNRHRTCCYFVRAVVWKT